MAVTSFVLLSRVDLARSTMCCIYFQAVGVIVMAIFSSTSTSWRTHFQIIVSRLSRWISSSVPLGVIWCVHRLDPSGNRQLDKGWWLVCWGSALRDRVAGEREGHRQYQTCTASLANRWIPLASFASTPRTEAAASREFFNGLPTWSCCRVVLYRWCRHHRTSSPPKRETSASIWRTPSLTLLQTLPGCEIIHLSQGLCGAKSPKPTTLLILNARGIIHEFRAWQITKDVPCRRRLLVAT